MSGKKKEHACKQEGEIMLYNMQTLQNMQTKEKVIPQSKESRRHLKKKNETEPTSIWGADIAVWVQAYHVR